MASSKEYLDYILEKLSPLDGITYRKMMGEYILYRNGRIFGGIYDDRFLIKPFPAAVEYMVQPVYAIPYDGGKPMLLVENTDDSQYMTELVMAIS